MLHVAVILWWSENIRLAEVSMTGARGYSHPSILVTRWGNYRPIITIRGKRILAMRVVEKSTTLLAESLQAIAGESILLRSQGILGIRQKPQHI